MMPPDTTPFRPAPAATTCSDCEGPLEAGQRWRCSLCQRAAELAVSRRTPGQAVRPSDVAAARAQEDDAP